MTFTVLIHHMGFFVDKPCLHYRDGCVNVHSGIDLDTWSFFECQDLVKDLGYTAGKFKLWWRKEDDAENHKIRPLLNDVHAMHLGSYAEYKKQNVEVFVEHDDEELPFSVICTPITVIPYNPPFKKPSSSMPAQPNTGSPKPPQIKGCQPKPFKSPSKNPDPSKPRPPKTAQPKASQAKIVPPKSSQPKNVPPKAGPPKSGPSNVAEAIGAAPNTAPMKKDLSQPVSAPKKVTPSKRPATQPLRRSNRLIWSNRKNFEQSQVVVVQKIQANAGDSAEPVEEATEVPATGEKEVRGQ